jgi:serine/threonine-protein kinase
MAQKIGKYEVIEELGRGAMGVVYKGKDPFIGRFVALKTITTGLQDQPELLQRFYREAQAAGGLQHPNVVTIYDLGEAQDGTPYIAMEFLEGEDLEKYINDQRQIPLSQKIGFIVQVASALNYAHKRGVVHRDIKPANIVVTKDGTPKVLDFGIARLVDTSRSQTGLLIGTVNYMSPEQVRGERVDARSDIFSLGVMFYELVCWQRPFLGSNFTAVMLAIISQEPKPLNELAPDCPKDLADVVHKLLRKDVGDRYQSLEEFLIDVDPVWKRLQRESVTDLVTQGEKLIQKKDFAAARDLLRQAVLIDTSHGHAKTLLEKVNAELKRSLVKPEVDERVQKAESLFKAGKLTEASAEAEAALKLDSMFAPAQELLKKVQEEAERLKTVKELLRTTKQRLAEGSLTEAESSLKKVLEIEAGGKEAQELKKQLDEEKVRRETRKRLLDSMQQARNLWTQQKYDECIKILTTLQKEFPSEAEVSKLLETVREDQAEQEKHQKLAEAKSLLSEQRFADALGVLEPVLQRYKDDPAVRKLYDHIQAERKIHAQRVRLEREQAGLKKLVAEEKWADAINKGEVLVKEFPEEIELARMVEYARSQQAILEHQRKLKEKSNEVLKWLDKADYPKAIKAAEQALEQFPGNLELKQMLDEARARQQEKEHKEFVEKQIRSIKAAMASDNHTEAISLAQQTLAVVKHDTDVTQLLQFAQREREMRDQKKSQDDQLKTVALLLKKEKFDEASRELQKAEKTQIFNPLDPRVQELMRAVKEKRAPSEEVIAAPGAPVDATVAGQYVYAPGRPAPAPPEPAGVKAEASPAVEPKASSVPMPVTPTPAPPPAIKPEPPKPEVKPEAKPPVKEEPPKKKAKPAVEEPPKKAKPAVEEPPARPVEEPKKPAVVEEPKKAKPAVVEEKPAVKPAPKPEVAPPPPMAIPAEEPKKSPALLYGGIAAGVVLAAVVGWFVMKGGGASGPTAEQKQIYDQAQQLYSERKLDQALAKYQEFVALGVGGEEKTTAESKAAEIQKLFADEKTAFDAAKAAQARKDYPASEAEYNKVIALNGKLKDDAETALETVRALARGEDPNTIERNKFAQAGRELQRGNYARAQGLFQEVVAMNLANKGAAESQLTVIEARLAEQKLFDEAMTLKGSGQNDPAKAKFQQVVQMNGPLKTQAQTQLTVIENAAAAEAERQKLMSQAQAAIGQNNFRSARSLIQQIQGLGGDVNDLTGRLAAAEKQEFDGLAGRVSQARSRDDDSQLRNLQRDAQAIADAGGSQAENARTLAQRDIPAAITEIVNKRAAATAAAASAKEAEDKKKFDDAVAAFNSSQKDSQALRGRVTSLFQAIAASNSQYAAQARDYLSNRIPEAVKAARPCPNIFVAAAAGGGLSQQYEAGAVVPTNRLDEKPAWTTCNWPAVNGTVMLTVTIDENGAVSDVKPRAPSPEFESAAAAVRGWKAAPAPKFKGLGVKTNVSVDIRP